MISRSRSKSTPVSVHTLGAEKRDQNGGEERREEARQHGRHVLDHALLRFDQPGGDHDRSGRPARQEPPLDQRLRVDPDGLNITTMNAVRTPPPSAIST